MFGMSFGVNLQSEKAHRQPAAKVLFVCTETDGAQNEKQVFG
jgi:hypothetical protein